MEVVHVEGPEAGEELCEDLLNTGEVSGVVLLAEVAGLLVHDADALLGHQEDQWHGEMIVHQTVLQALTRLASFFHLEKKGGFINLKMSRSRLCLATYWRRLLRWPEPSARWRWRSRPSWFDPCSVAQALANAKIENIEGEIGDILERVHHGSDQVFKHLKITH